MDYNREEYAWITLRILLGLIFLWAFFDKLLGLGFSTCRNSTTNVVTLFCKDAWIHGGSPTYGFLKFGTAGPLAPLYQAIAGNVVVDWLFMIGLLCIGVALILGIAMRITSIIGALLVLLMWSAHLPPTTNPLLDEHLIYAVVFIILAAVHAGHWFGLEDRWEHTKLVHMLPFLK